MPTNITITGKEISTIVRLGLLSILVYYGAKLVFETIDTTKKRPGQLSQKEVLRLSDVYYVICL
jgi:hypothetical protein